MLFDLSSLNAVVTGATRGIGLSIAEQLAAHGARVVISSRNQACCDRIAEAMNARAVAPSGIATGIACDIEDFDSIDHLARASSERFGGVDILICNATVPKFRGPSAQTPPALFDQILQANIHSNFRLCQAMRVSMTARGGGSIILIGSLAGHVANPNTMAYSVAKAGVAHMARCLAEELAPSRIRVNCVSPGLIRAGSPAGDPRQPTMPPLGRLGEPQDVAGAVVYLASNAGSFVTGTTLFVDGGLAFLAADSSQEPASPSMVPRSLSRRR